MRRLRNGIRNATEMMRLGRLVAPYRTPYAVVHHDRVFDLRHYETAEHAPEGTTPAAVLLVPPLMVTSEIYDMAPDVSGVSFLLGRGLDVWMVDFGAPERVEGGLKRTLDDHVLAVSSAIDLVRGHTNRDVHLAGYSQGGMFCYQAAAYRAGEGIRSLITFGSPVDIHRAFPVPVGEEIAERIISGLRTAIERPIAQLEGLPGQLTSVGFKLISPRKEVQQLVDFVTKLHDRHALEKRESRRRFLGGEGFVAWPGPALRTFIDEFIVANRLASGGFVVDGYTVSLADVRCPILSFVGLQDDIARPAAVRAIRSIAFNAEVHEAAVPTGHLGLVVGSHALSTTWPVVSDWVRWLEHAAAPPELLDRNARSEDASEASDEIEDIEIDLGDVLSFATTNVERMWDRVVRTAEDLTETADALRWQLPRLRRLRNVGSDTPISMARTLAEQAERLPDRTFFLWKGRAFSYADANRRVEAVVRGLIQCGVRPGERVAVLMRPRPSYLSIVTALNRLGAVAVLLSPETTRVSLERALKLGEADRLVTDPANAEVARNAFDGPVLALGGPYGTERRIPQGVVDMEAIEPDAVELPSWYEPNPGRARDLAMVLFTPGHAEQPRAARITNRRWAFSALGAAAGCTLTPQDTVYCALPLHHAAGMLVAVGGALVGGSRLALARRFQPDRFWDDVRRYGATAVFYAGEMCRPLVDAPPHPSDRQNPVRLFAGSGMRIDVWRKLQHRFGAGVLEFYASTEGNAVLANASGQKSGALGRPLPGAPEMALAAYDFTRDQLVRDEEGFIQRCGAHTPGVLLARVDPDHPMAGFDGYLDDAATEQRVLRDVFEPDDRWFVTGDLMLRDADGDYWFVDRLADVMRTAQGTVFTREVEDLLYRRPDVQQVAVYGAVPPGEDEPVVVAAIVPRAEELDLDGLATLVADKLTPRQRPRFVRIVDRMPMSDGHRPLKRALAQQGLAAGAGPLYALDDGRFVPVPPN